MTPEQKAHLATAEKLRRREARDKALDAWWKAEMAESQAIRELKQSKEKAND